MKTKLARVAKAVRKTFGICGMEAVDVAEYLLKRHDGNVREAIITAQHPFRINGKAVY